MSIKKGKQFSPLIESIDQVLSYVDTVIVWLSQHLNKVEKETLDLLCCDGINYHKPTKFFYIVTDKNAWRPAVGIQLNQPTQEALVFLQKIQERNGASRLYRVDVALDLVTRSERDATELRDYIFLRLMKGWARPEHKFRINGKFPRYTTYIGRRKDNLVYVGYTDRKSKVAGKHCCHLEIRMTGHQSLRAKSLVSPFDLLKFDAYAFLQNKVRLYDIDRRKLGKALRGYHGNVKRKLRLSNFTYDRDLACANVYLHYLWDRLGCKEIEDRRWGTSPAISQLSEVFRDKHRGLKRFLVEVDVESIFRKMLFMWPSPARE